MKQEIRQNVEMIIESDDNISIPIIFNNLIGKNSRTNKGYQAYIKYTAITLMGFQYRKIVFWVDGELKETVYVTKFLLIT